jgi:hypothetical protein
MNGTQPPQVHAQRQSGKPIQPLLQIASGGKLLQRALVLADVFGGMRPQRSAVGIMRMEAQRIDFMIAQDGQGISGFHHAAHDFQRGHNLRPAVNVIPKEDDLPPFRRGNSVCSLPISEVAQQFSQRGGVSMNVADDVVTIFHTPTIPGGMALAYDR